MCTTFYLTPFVLSFPKETSVSNVHFNAAIIIRRRVFCTLPVSLFVPNNYHRIPSRHHLRHHQNSRYAMQVIHNGRQSAAPLQSHGRSRCNSLTQTAKCRQTDNISNTKPTPNPSKERRRQQLGSTLAHLFHMQRNKPRGHMYLRDTAIDRELSKESVSIICEMRHGTQHNNKWRSLRRQVLLPGWFPCFELLSR